MNKKYFNAAVFLIAGLAIGQVYTHFVSAETKSKAIEKLEKPSVKEETEKEKPKIEIQTIEVTISGAVKKPGKYKLKKGSQILDLIETAGGFAPGAQTRIKNYYLKNASEFTIKYREEIQVEIIGQVQKPGKYRMYKGDRLSSLVDKAGGITPLGIMPKNDYYLNDGKKFFIPKRREGDNQ